MYRRHYIASNSVPSINISLYPVCCDIINTISTSYHLFSPLIMCLGTRKETSSVASLHSGTSKVEGTGASWWYIILDEPFVWCVLQVWPTRAPSVLGRVILSSRTRDLSPGVRPPTNSDTGRREHDDGNGSNLFSGKATGWLVGWLVG